MDFSFIARLGRLKLDYFNKKNSYEILFLYIVHRTFMKREFYEKWQGGDIDTGLLN